jgi:hypothetical protein
VTRGPRPETPWPSHIKYTTMVGITICIVIRLQESVVACILQPWSGGKDHDRYKKQLKKNILCPHTRYTNHSRPRSPSLNGRPARLPSAYPFVYLIYAFCNRNLKAIKAIKAINKTLFVHARCTNHSPPRRRSLSGRLARLPSATCPSLQLIPLPFEDFKAIKQQKNIF